MKPKKGNIVLLTLSDEQSEQIYRGLRLNVNQQFPMIVVDVDEVDGKVFVSGHVFVPTKIWWIISAVEGIAAGQWRWPPAE